MGCMKERFIGEVIRGRREELGLTQDQLCEGICEPITISRLENRKQTPSRNTVVALLHRLGLPEDRYYALLTDKELELERLRKDISALIIKYERAAEVNRENIKEQAFSRIAEMERKISKTDTISLQFLVKSKVALGENKENVQERIDILKDALKLTCPNINFKKLETGLFSYDELTVLNQIASTYSMQGEHDKALEIWYQIYRNVKRRFDNIVHARGVIDLIFYGLAKELLIVHRYDDAKKYAQIGRDNCIDYGIYQHLPGYLIILAECAYQTGDTKGCRELLVQSFYFCKIIDDEQNKRIVANSLKDYFNMEIA